MKQFRALLEQDMGCPEKSLREHKDDIEEMVDQVDPDMTSLHQPSSHVSHNRSLVV